MVMSRRVITHSDQNGLYSVIVKPGHGLVVAFGPMLFSDKCWTHENIWGNDESSIIHTQQHKCRHPDIEAELTKLRQTAERHKVPLQNVLFVDCSGDMPIHEIVPIVQSAFARGTPLHEISDCIMPNYVGIALTSVVRDQVWKAVY